MATFERNQLARITSAPPYPCQPSHPIPEPHQFGVVMLAVAAVSDVVHTLHLFFTEQPVTLGAGDVEAHPAARLVAAHAGAELGLARPSVQLAQIAGLWPNGGTGGAVVL